ncbi:hypothetical protein CLV71_12068 [Actinophytocola oryzae]|uniref:Uncharacterized protein n=1 Tax=Actinophytocola oryzae TaxID=502181 RepID=A0A4R7UX34_9PSEU|nr:hypothetical protein CLV71_12068 [Actinophytocola oryzae]
MPTLPGDPDRAGSLTTADRTPTHTPTGASRASRSTTTRARRPMPTFTRDPGRAGSLTTGIRTPTIQAFRAGKSITRRPPPMRAAVGGASRVGGVTGVRAPITGTSRASRSTTIRGRRPPALTRDPRRASSLTGARTPTTEAPRASMTTTRGRPSLRAAAGGARRAVRAPGFVVVGDGCRGGDLGGVTRGDRGGFPRRILFGRCGVLLQGVRDRFRRFGDALFGSARFGGSFQVGGHVGHCRRWISGYPVATPRSYLIR